MKDEGGGGRGVDGVSIGSGRCPTCSTFVYKSFMYYYYHYYYYYYFYYTTPTPIPTIDPTTNSPGV